MDYYFIFNNIQIILIKTYILDKGKLIKYNRIFIQK